MRARFKIEICHKRSIILKAFSQTISVSDLSDLATELCDTVYMLRYAITVLMITTEWTIFTKTAFKLDVQGSSILPNELRMTTVRNVL